MKIMSCDFHPSYTQNAMLDTVTGEIVEKALSHQRKEEVRAFYARLEGSVRVGIEASGQSQWFERMLVQLHLTVIRALAELVSARTALVNAARGLVKSSGQRLPKCGTYQVSEKLAEGLSAELREVLVPLFQEIESLNERVKEYDERMEKIAKEVYPEVSLLKQVKGAGTQIALTYVLTIEDPYRFRKSREVGCFLGLRPGRRNSGESKPQKGISKAGDRYLRTMMVQGAHYILGPFGEDSDLRRWGLKLAERGGKNAKKRAVVAVARKLAVLLHKLWVSGEVYEPLRNNRKVASAAA